MNPATIRIDDDGDLLIDASTPDECIGLVLSQRPGDSGWYVARRDGPRSGDGGSIDDAGIATIRAWCAGGPTPDLRALVEAYGEASRDLGILVALSTSPATCVAVAHDERGVVGLRRYGSGDAGLRDSVDLRLLSGAE